MIARCECRAVAVTSLGRQRRCREPYLVEPEHPGARADRLGLATTGAAGRTTFGMLGDLDLSVFRDFATALLIGALIGVEREKRKGDGEPGIGGLRTFILFALTGAVAGLPVARRRRCPGS